jgi:5-deoxy-glucuronate isomerase
MNLLYKGKDIKKGYNFIVGPQNSSLKWLEFGRIYLSQEGDLYKDRSEDREIVLCLLEGKCDIHLQGNFFDPLVYANIGGRKDVFSAKPTMIYIPPQVELEVLARTSEVQLGVFKAPSSCTTPPRLISPTDVSSNWVGSSNWKREVILAIGDKVKAERLIVGETISPPGNWSSYPPHKHDTRRPPSEAPYEEVYFFKVRPSQGFAIQWIYADPSAADPLNEIYVVENNDTVVITRGYHPVVAGAGYELYYLWALAGEGRDYAAWSDDPRHAWIKD